METLETPVPMGRERRWNAEKKLAVLKRVARRMDVRALALEGRTI